MPFKKPGILLASALIVLIPFTTTITAQEATVNNKLSFQRDPASKNIRLLRSQSGAISLHKDVGESTADAVKRQFAPHFGISNPATDLIVIKEFSPSASQHNIRYQQLHNGIPVIGGELVANLNAKQQLTSMSGETSQVKLTNLVPKISAAQAQSTAINAASKWYGLDTSSLKASKAELSIYDPSLIGPGAGQHRLVWKFNVTTTKLSAINELMLVDAQSNVIALHFNTIDGARDRVTYDAGGISTLPGTQVCNESQPNCTNGTDPDADAAHIYAGDTYDFYASEHMRDGIDNAGSTIISTVHWNDGITCPNAFWSGTQMVYCDGFSQADDVVAHELTHGVTNNTSNLFYYFQSGAINESLSDLWGEFVDLGNSSGNDDANVRWQVGEDVPGFGTFRDMANPETYGDPDRMTSTNYVTDTSDNGGVHSNSGVNNKAVFLMVDGGSFNNQTITGMGISKTAKLYYQVQTTYLTTASDYLDLYNALTSACTDLVGNGDLTNSDCTDTVAPALLAVEMNQQPVTDFNPEAEVCPVGDIKATVFYDDFESGLTNWTNTNLQGATPWRVGLNYATSGNQIAYVPGTSTLADSVLTQNSAIAIPASGTYYVRFNHFFDYESQTVNNITANYDGGVIEYSTNNGVSWTDANSLIDSGRNYNGTINGSANPIVGRDGFVSTSHGYNSTRINLSSLAGQSVRLQFRNTADTSVASPRGWGIDDFRVYTCNEPPVANAGSDQDVVFNTGVNLNGNGSSDPENGALLYLWTQTGGTSTVTLTSATTATPSFTSPNGMDTLTFQLQVTDNTGQTDTDTVTVTVNAPPSADAGSDRDAFLNIAFSLDGSGSSDPEGGPLTYNWAQLAGTAVSLSNPNAQSPSFTPDTLDTLTFQLTVTDNLNQTDTDTVTITVQNAPPSSSGCTVSENGRFDPIWLSLLLLLSLIHLRRRRSN